MGRLRENEKKRVVGTLDTLDTRIGIFDERVLFIGLVSTFVSFYPFRSVRVSNILYGTGNTGQCTCLIFAQPAQPCQSLLQQTRKRLCIILSPRRECSQSTFDNSLPTRSLLMSRNKTSVHPGGLTKSISIWYDAYSSW